MKNVVKLKTSEEALTELVNVINWWNRIDASELSANNAPNLHDLIIAVATSLLNVMKPAIELALHEVDNKYEATLYINELSSKPKLKPDKTTKFRGELTTRYYHSAQDLIHLKCFREIAHELGLKIFVDADGHQFLLLSTSWLAHVVAKLNLRDATISPKLRVTAHLNLYRLHLCADIDFIVGKERVTEPGDELNQKERGN